TASGIASPRRGPTDCCPAAAACNEEARGARARSAPRRGERGEHASEPAARIAARWRVFADPPAGGKRRTQRDGVLPLGAPPREPRAARRGDTRAPRTSRPPEHLAQRACLLARPRLHGRREILRHARALSGPWRCAAAAFLRERPRPNCVS